MPPMLELDDESKISKNLSAIKEICSWLQTFRPSNPGGSQEHNLVAFFFLLLFDHLCYMMDIVQVTFHRFQHLDYVYTTELLISDLK